MLAFGLPAQEDSGDNFSPYADDICTRQQSLSEAASPDRASDALDCSVLCRRTSLPRTCLPVTTTNSHETSPSGDASPAPSSSAPSSSGLSSPPSSSDTCMRDCAAVEDGLLELSSGGPPSASSDSSGGDDGPGGNVGRSRYRSVDDDCVDSGAVVGRCWAAAKRRRVATAGGRCDAEPAVCAPKHLWRADDLVGRTMVLF